VSFNINKCCNDEKFCNDDSFFDDKNTIRNTNDNLYNSTTSPDSKPILIYKYKFQRFSTWL
jgi:hypothetical protein